MSMTGTIVNALAIVAGGAVGLLFQRGIPERVSKTVMIGLGLCVSASRARLRVGAF